MNWIYKYYILKVRRTNEYGEFIYNESSKLVCIKNDIIDHEEVVEDIDNPPPPQKMPDKVKYYETKNIMLMDLILVHMTK